MIKLSEPRRFTPADLAPMLALIGAHNRAFDLCTNLHMGDVCFFISKELRGRDPAPHFWLFDDAAAGTLAAVVVLWEVDDPLVDVLYAPEVGADAVLLHTLYDFAEAAMIRLAQADGVHIEHIAHEVLSCAPASLGALLEARGYTPDLPQFVLTRRSLGEPFPAPVLPTGFVLRRLRGLDEADAAGRLYKRAFGSTWAAEEYRAVVGSPAFAYGEQLVVVAPDERLAAFCVCWHDLVSRSGLFEPVGVDPDFQRRGLASALAYEGMRRMQAAGIKTAIIKHQPPEKNPPAAALYAHLGFATIGVGIDWRRQAAARPNASVADPSDRR